MDLLIALSDVATGIITAGPDFNPDPQAPPGMEGIATIINWVAWGAAIVCGIVIIACGGWLALSVFQGQEVRAAKGLVVAIVACLFVGAAGAIVGALF